MTLRHTPFAILGPGDTIREELAFPGWIHQTLSDALGLSRHEVRRLLGNRMPLSCDLATRLGKAFGQSPQFWLNQDARYRALAGVKIAKQTLIC
jgi:addiction module HigA family antidote